MIDNVFTGNRADYGGPIAIEHGGDIRIVRNQFCNSNPGLDVGPYTGDWRITNNVFVDEDDEAITCRREEQGSGTGIYEYPSNGAFRNNDVLDNVDVGAIAGADFTYCSSTSTRNNLFAWTTGTARTTCCDS